MISGYLFIFFTQFIGINPLHFATIILLVKIWDGINDPIIGALCDRIAPKNGDKFRPWIFWGSFSLAISGVIIFINTSEFPYGAKLAVFVVGYLVWDVCYTIVNVPYGSLNSNITADPIERSQLSTFRSFGGVFGGIILGIVIPLLVFKKETIDGTQVSTFQGDKMFFLAAVLGVLSLICFQLLYRWTIERVHSNAAQENVKFNYFRTLKEFFTSRPLLGRILASVSVFVFIMGSQQLGQLVFQLYFGNGQLAALSGVATVIPMLAMGPFIKHLVKRFGKKELCSYPLLGSILIYILMLILPIKSPIIWILMLMLANTCSIMLTMLGWALMTDCIDAQEIKTGRREEGSIYATFTMCNKMAQGFGAALVPAMIAFVIPGLDLKNTATWTTEYATSVKNLSVIMPLVGLIIVFISMTYIYNLDKKTVASMQEQLGRVDVKDNVASALDSIAATTGRREE
ncbi:MAG TPA: MFS transporter [Clostridiales bacterium]|nr:MFS transporter [Clostridiales bacterium]